MKRGDNFTLNKDKTGYRIGYAVVEPIKQKVEEVLLASEILISNEAIKAKKVLS